MDRTELIAKAAQEPEDRLLLAKVLDKYEQKERRGIPTVTGFLSPRQQQMALSLLRAAGVRDGFVLDGGYEGAERQTLAFLPEWAEAGEELVFLRAAFRDPAAALTHRDLLGSLMGLGVERDRVGDILVSPHSADIVSVPSLRDFFLREWESAGRVRLDVTEIRREDLLLPAVQVRTIRDTLSSPRLDAAVATAFSMSRGKAAELIGAGRVSLDYTVCQKADKPVAEGTILSVRGLGRAKIVSLGGLSRKGRLGVTIERYL